MDELLSRSELPDWFSYPSEFLLVVNKGMSDIGQWQMLDGKWLKVRMSGLKSRFPDRSLVPFARRLDSDDVACWDKEQPGSVVIVHDFCAPGWERRDVFDSFDSWYSAALAETRNEED